MTNYIDFDEVTVEDAKRLLWLSGNLSFLVQDHQDDMWSRITEHLRDRSDESPITYVFNISRRYGKTTTLLLKSTEIALTHPGVIIRYVFPFAKDAKEIMREFEGKFYTQCPAEIRPQWKENSYYKFHNGSELIIHGANNYNENKLRGKAADIIIVDEAGDMGRLEYLINDVLMPQLLTTNGKMFVASTPPPIPGHFYKTVYERALVNGCVSEYTIDDNTSISEKRKAAYIKESGGIDSPTVQREYYVKFDVDLDRMLIPNFDLTKHVQRKERPNNYNRMPKYVGIDLGGVNDNTAGVFGYVDRNEGVFHIEGELTSRGVNETTEQIYTQLTDKVAELEYNAIERTIVDNNNPQFVKDINAQGFQLTPVSKNKTPMEFITDLRKAFVAGKITIDPDCEMLIGCLSNGIWKYVNAETKMKPTKMMFGYHPIYRHFDHVAALMYLWKYVNLDTWPEVLPYDPNRADMTPDQIKKYYKKQQGLNALARKVRGR